MRFSPEIEHLCECSRPRQSQALIGRAGNLDGIGMNWDVKGYKRGRASDVDIPLIWQQPVHINIDSVSAPPGLDPNYKS